MVVWLYEDQIGSKEEGRRTTHLRSNDDVGEGEAIVQEAEARQPSSYEHGC
jgi:hypothetical protein